MLAFVHSYYSLRYGTLSPEELALEAKTKGYQALALTDINYTSGVFPFIKACLAQGIQPLVGIEFRRDNQWLYTGIAQNQQGFRELNRFLSTYLLQHQPLPDVPPEFNHAYIIYPFARYNPNHNKNPLRANEYVAVAPADVNKLHFSDIRKHPEKLLMWGLFTCKNQTGLELHQHLRAIDNNILLSQLNPAHGLSDNNCFLPSSELLIKYQQLPALIRNAEKLATAAAFSFDFTSRKNKFTFTGTASDDKELLEKLAWDGLRNRYGASHQEAKQRVAHELAIIHKLGFSSYFLITWDVIRYSLSRNFYHVGRGSGANSVVAYCLRITDVDPIQLDLYFERFLNPKRTSPPDFDIDYSWLERDEVLDYIFKRYQKEHTALLGAMSTFQPSSILRELGKVYGLPKAELDALVEQPAAPGNANHLTGQIFRYGKLLTDFPNLRSIHAGGVLISEEPITNYTALDMPPKGMPTTQWDMYTAEDIGFEKLDILSQRGIGHIKECVDLVWQNQQIKIDAHDIERFKQDEKVKAQLKAGSTIGCFYIESPAMRGLLKKLRCDNYLSLVAASSIIRPGVAQSGMMRTYIQRFHAPDKIQYLHPVMEEQLKETFGVMVYQEDVIKVAHHFAGLDLADADVLRRGMSGKYRSKTEFQKLVDKFFSNCQAKGYPEALTKEVWRQIESFAGYSFSKAHSASFAVESYQSLYLKTYYPLEFMTAVINNFGGFYKTWVYVQQAQKAGAVIHLPCVNHSFLTTAIFGHDMYLGLIHIQHLEQKLAQTMVAAQQQNGPYTSLENFIQRTGITLEALLILIRVQALRFTGQSKKALLWEAHLLLGYQVNHRHTNLLFQAPAKTFTLPALTHTLIEDAYDEIELLGFPVSCTYFDLLQTKFRGEVLATNLLPYVGQKVRMLGILVTTKYVRTVKGDIMQFGTFLDVDGFFFDTVHFPQSLKLWPFKGFGVYLLYGKVVEEFGFPSIEVEKLAKMPFQKDPRY
ncbi:DNA polymerase III subunit alpha [Adhaeribacter rhizoryzae]|uniref:DNA polymerase III subunit alpha n=1 Tax=Adhaeribacter rhizoryzae TaxID=2607907 RepID=A0A5M6DPE4_9BACT|nr:DNA polymerase III subunit alpha [Adhaeribacter rhizoryzae]KAA5548102.1 DNA polymerase III subunit alpha [Adhaeribacter rhizoryzae]